MANAICVKCLSRICDHVMVQPARITPKRARALMMLAGGCSNKEIATATGTTEGTVKAMLVVLYPILGVTTRLEAGIWALQHMELLKGPLPQ